MKKALSLEKFSLLLLATLANNSKMIYLRKKDRNKKTACLPANYKQTIENILCEGNGWEKTFSCLIDTKAYFENHFLWEWQLSLVLKKTLQKLNKNIEYHFTTDSLYITFTQEEVDIILNSFKNKHIKETMSHFANLIVDYIYTREYKEKYYNKDEKSIKLMRELEKNKYSEVLDTLDN